MRVFFSSCVMPRTRSSTYSSAEDVHLPPSSQSTYSQGPSTYPSTLSQSDKIPCPFKNYDGWIGGVAGRGYAKSAIYKHIHAKHFPTERDKEKCRDRICNNIDCYLAWEKSLSAMQMWLCIQCLHVHAWKKPCSKTEWCNSWSIQWRQGYFFNSWCWETSRGIKWYGFHTHCFSDNPG